MANNITPNRALTRPINGASLNGVVYLIGKQYKQSYFGWEMQQYIDRAKRDLKIAMFTEFLDRTNP